MPYLILLFGLAIIFFQYVPASEVRYVNAVVTKYAGKPGAAGGVEFLVMKTEDGNSVSVGLVGRPSIGDEMTLSVQDRRFLFGPIYRIHTSN